MIGRIGGLDDMPLDVVGLVVFVLVLVLVVGVAFVLIIGVVLFAALFVEKDYLHFVSKTRERL